MAGALLEVAAVSARGESAVGYPYHPAQAPVSHVGLDLPDQRGVAGVAGPAPAPDRDSVSGDRHSDHDLGKVVAAVFGFAVRAEPGHLVSISLVIVAGGFAAPVPGDRIIVIRQFEVSGGGVEKKQVDFQVQQVSDLMVDLFL